MNAEIITIGDELLIGQVVDTNSAWMAKALEPAGVRVVRKVAIGDDATEITNALDLALLRSEIVFLTGGLGPTKDDITKKVLCDYFKTRLVLNQDVLVSNESMFVKWGKSMNELTYSQAYVPENAVVFVNAVGTAPITWFETDGKVVVSLPGVPSEMKWAMQECILPRIAAQYKQDLYVAHRTVWIKGYTESALAIYLADFEAELSYKAKLAYLPSYGMIRLRISVYLQDEVECNQIADKYLQKLEGLLGDAIFAHDDISLQRVIGQLLLDSGKYMATAESCTGGAIAASITANSGSSAYYKGSVVSYHNDVKHDVLGVKEDDLLNYGAVSESVVEQMAQGVIKALGVDYAVATSGIAG
ncbi:MAG: CinA family nicotinamide mononucleotide deamidase-related protein, partial [Tannerellaceae bacterium]